MSCLGSHLLRASGAGWGAPGPDNGLEPSKGQDEILQGVAEFRGQVVPSQGGVGPRHRLPEVVHMVLGGGCTTAVLALPPHHL